jgi:hypothetical protein
MLALIILGMLAGLFGLAFNLEKILALSQRTIYGDAREPAKCAVSRRPSRARR